MKKILSLAVVSFMLFSFNVFSAEQPQEKFLRGVWVSSVVNLDFPSKCGLSREEQMKELDEVVYNCVEMGMNAIFFQVRPCADALYNSKIFPASIFLTGESRFGLEFDPLEYIVKKAHENGIELHAWINPYRVTRLGENDLEKLDPDSPQRLHPEYLLQSEDGNYFFNPSLSEVRKLIVDGIIEIIDGYDVDGIHFDDYFYPESPYDDSSYFEASGSGDIAKWREENVNALVKQVHDTIKEKNPEISFGISPRGVWANAYENPRGSATKGGGSLTQIHCDSLKFISEGWVDYICPQLYWSIGYDAADYRILLPWWVNAVQGTDVKLYIGMGDYRTEGAAEDSPWYGTEELSRQTELNSAYSEVFGEVHFRYKIIAENPQLKELYKEKYNGRKIEENPTPSAKIEKNLKKILRALLLG